MRIANFTLQRRAAARVVFFFHNKIDLLHQYAALKTVFIASQYHFIGFGFELCNKGPLSERNAQPLALTNGIVNQALVLAQHRSPLP